MGELIRKGRKGGMRLHRSRESSPIGIFKEFELYM